MGSISKSAPVSGLGTAKLYIIGGAVGCILNQAAGEQAWLYSVQIFSASKPPLNIKF